MKQSTKLKKLWNKVGYCKCGHHLNSHFNEKYQCIECNCQRFENSYRGLAKSIVKDYYEMSKNYKDTLSLMEWAFNFGSQVKTREILSFKEEIERIDKELDSSEQSKETSEKN